MDAISAAGMDETYGTDVDDECFDMHDYHVILIMICTMILMMILKMILTMIPMMVGAGTCIQSRLKDQGPCLGTNEHPRRDTDVILRQSNAPIAILNSR